MNQTLTDVLACPLCHGTLSLQLDKKDAIGPVDGRLVCSSCAQSFTVNNGIYRFNVTDAVQQDADGDTWVAEDFINLVPESGLYYNHAQWLERHLKYPAKLARLVAEYEYPHRIGAILEALELGDRPVVADIGCGVGYLLFHALERFRHLKPRLLGLDVLPTHIQYFRARQVEERTAAMIPILGDSAKLPIPDATLDAIICSEVVEHLPEPHVCFAEMRRVLKPHGQLIITTPNAGPYNLYHGWRGKIAAAFGQGDKGEGFYDAPVTPQELAGLLVAAGFELKHHECNIKVPFSKRVLQNLPANAAWWLIETLEKSLPGRFFGMNQVASAVKL